MHPIRLVMAAAFLFFASQPGLHAERRQQPSVPLTINLFKLASGPCMSKGRLQDPEFDKSKERLEEMNRIMHHGTDSVTALAESLTNSHPVPPMLCGWKGMALGDVALVALLDLFRDSNDHSTVPELDWDTFLERSSPNLSAEQVLRKFIRSHRRSGLRQKWDSFWNEHKDDLIWDEQDHCYRLSPAHS